MKLKLTLLMMLCIALQPAQASEVSNQEHGLIVYEQQWHQCDHHLVRKGLFFKVVDVDWYAPTCQDSINILSKSPVLLRFSYFRSIKREFFIASASDYFLRNLNNSELQSQNQINEFNSAYQDVQDGDIYDLVINAKGDLNLYKNKRLIQSSNNPLIRNNYLKIWFGKDPVVPALKQAFKSL